MIAKNITLFSLRKIVSGLNGAVLSLLVMVFFFFFWFSSLPRGEIHFVSKKWDRKAAQKLEKIDYSQIDRGPFEIYSEDKAFCLPDMGSEVRFLKKIPDQIDRSMMPSCAWG